LHGGGVWGICCGGAAWTAAQGIEMQVKDIASNLWVKFLNIKILGLKLLLLFSVFLRQFFF